MRYETTARSIAIPLDKDENVQRLDHHDWDIMSEYLEDEADRVATIMERLEAITGIDSVEFNGHFGNYVYLRVEVDGMFTALAKVAEIIKPWLPPADHPAFLDLEST